MTSFHKDGVFPAISDDEKSAVHRFRYDIYVMELGRYRSIADHEARKLFEPEDAQSHLFYSVRNGQVVATMRLTWGGDEDLPNRMIEQYSLDQFLDDIPQSQFIIGERFMVAKEHRGSDVLSEMFVAYLKFVNDNRIQLIFGDCEPYLLNLYLGMGFRTYSQRNVTSKETGYLIPLVMIPEDIDYFRSLKSPLANVLKDFGTDTRVPKKAMEILNQGSAVLSEQLTSKKSFFSEVYQYVDELEENRPNLFDGLDDNSIQACLSKSTIIDCQKGDVVIKKDNVAQNLFFVLSGILEVIDGNKVVNILKTGDVFGEIAFLLGRTRTADVIAITDSTRVICMSESTVRKMIEADPKSAAQLLLNISKMLCVKLITKL